MSMNEAEPILQNAGLVIDRSSNKVK
jgi:hypothetical protein